MKNQTPLTQFLLVSLLLAPTLAFLLSPLAALAAELPAIELGTPFADNAILQRDKDLPVWGWSKPGTTVTVEFAGQKESATAGVDGKWMLNLKPLKASGEPNEMFISGSEGKKVTLSNILVGEVWHASGQSNMEWLASKSNCSSLAQLVAKENFPLRELRTDTVSALYPQKRVPTLAGWKTSKDAANFSALALAFAYELYRELKVPVGILLTSHSNTRIEAFTERKAIETHSLLKADSDLIANGDVGTNQGKTAFEKFYKDLDEWQKASAELGFPLERPLPRPNLPGIAGEWRGPSQFYNGKIAPIVPFAIRGSIWNQGEANASDGRIYAARMEALIKGWRDAWSMPDMPFYFTQMQCYGSPNPDELGMADVRQAQHLFFKNNRKNVGMVVQTDFNPANPGGIHYANKLHPGMRLARWALANEYGREIAFTGPIYEKYEVVGNRVIVSFEDGSLFGGLMVGSKGLEKDMREPDKYVEPARPTPDEKINHFRLCGKDRKWFAADAVIDRGTVIVTSKDVPDPVGVQYAYNATPMQANLYNKAGLPATPFAVIDGKLIFEEDDLEKAAARKAKNSQNADPDHPVFQVAAYYRDGAIIQRDQAIPVWGFANKGVTVTVTLGGVTQSTTANSQQQWSVAFPAMKPSDKPITLTAKSSHGMNIVVGNILVGDVWFLTGSGLLTTEMANSRSDKDSAPLEALPLVREFRRKTSASTSPVPRKRGFEIGGDLKYRSRWQTAEFTSKDGGVSMFAYHFAKSLDRPGIPQGFITMSSGGKDATASPLSWTSFAGVRGLANPAFSARMNVLMQWDTSSDLSKKSIAEYVQTLKASVAKVSDMARQGADMSTASLQYPAFPEPGRSGDVNPDAIPTYAYNWCVSPLTPMAVAGVIWVPGEFNIGHTPADYAAELETYAKSLPLTYGQEKVPFFYAQPSNTLLNGISAPSIPGAKCVIFEKWPKSLSEIADQLGK